MRATSCADLLAEQRHPGSQRAHWVGHCDELREEFPIIEECHADPPGFISPYLFLKRLEPYPQSPMP